MFFFFAIGGYLVVQGRLSLGALVAALAAYREALVLRQQLDVPDLVAESLNNVAFCSFQLGQFDNALVYWQQAAA